MQRVIKILYRPGFYTKEKSMSTKITVKDRSLENSGGDLTGHTSVVFAPTDNPNHTGGKSEELGGVVPAAEKVQLQGAIAKAVQLPTTARPNAPAPRSTGVTFYAGTSKDRAEGPAVAQPDYGYP